MQFIIYKMPKTRKTFYLNDDESKPVTACGIMLYRFVDNELEFLVVEGRGMYEDFGGQTDPTDKDLYHTAARETYEESNKLIKKSSLKKRLKKADYVYNARSKYVIFIMKANKDEKKLEAKDFGDRELHDDIPRKVRWLNSDTMLNADIIKHKLNFRLKMKSFFDKVKEIKNDKKLDKSILSDSNKDD